MQELKNLMLYGEKKFQENASEIVETLENDEEIKEQVLSIKQEFEESLLPHEDESEKPIESEVQTTTKG